MKKKASMRPSKGPQELLQRTKKQRDEIEEIDMDNNHASEQVQFSPVQQR